MRNVKRTIAAVVVILVFSFTVFGCVSNTVAEVNSEKITQAQLNKRVRKIKMAYEAQGLSFTGKDAPMLLKALEEQTLEDMITQLMISHAARKEGVYPTKTAIGSIIKKIVKDNFGDETKFKEELSKHGLTVKDIEDRLTYETAYAKLYEKVTADIKVTDAEAQQWYENNKESYKNPPKIKARAILVKFNNPDETPNLTGEPASKTDRNEQDARKIAEVIIKQLDKGTDFAKLAKEKSEDEKSKNDGGLIKDYAGQSPYPKGMMPPEFDEAAVSLKEGSYTKTPVKTKDGYYVIKLESLIPETQLPFAEVKEKIKQELSIKQKQDKFTEYIANLRKNSKIVNKLSKNPPQK